MHFKDYRSPHLIYNAAGRLVLHGYVKVVASIPDYCHIVL
ncbi:unnamed protein product, partial [marine sediment metagenome]